MHIVALEVDWHVHRLHCMGPASPRWSSVARSRHVGHKLRLVKGYKIEGDDGFFVCLVAKRVGKRIIQITLSLSNLGLFFPVGVDLF